MAEGKPSRYKETFKKFRDSGKTKNLLVFLLFVLLSTVFWYILTLNDEVQKSYDMKVMIEDVPDSITFISPMPTALHITVKDRGMNLMKYDVGGAPVLHLKFSEFAEAGVFKVSQSKLISSVRNLLGPMSIVTSINPDSIRLVYTDLPGREIPVVLDYDISVAPGLVLGSPKMEKTKVTVFSTDKNDTVSRIISERIVLKDIDKNVTIEVPLKTLSGRKVDPNKINVTFVVEQLVKKEATIPVTVDRVPNGEDILFFPSKVKVAYYVPVSQYNSPDDEIKIEASFKEAVNTTSDKVGLKLVSKAPYITKIELLQDSVEYTLVRNM